MWSKVLLHRNLLLTLSVLNSSIIRSVVCCMATGNESLAGVFSVSYVTTPNTDVANELAKGLVSHKLAACVNIIPQVQSVYEWKDEIQTDSEALMMIKSRTSRLGELTKFVRENHPYEVCEVISVPIQQGNVPYLKWIGEVVPEKTG